MSNSSTKPIAEVRRGAVKASIWKNAIDDGNNSRNVFNVTFQRLYRDEQSKWHGSESFGRDDLLIMAQVAQKAFDRIHELQQSERQTERAAQP